MIRERCLSAACSGFEDKPSSSATATHFASGYLEEWSGLLWMVYIPRQQGQGGVVGIERCPGRSTAPPGTPDIEPLCPVKYLAVICAVHSRTPVNNGNITLQSRTVAQLGRRDRLGDSIAR